jgi:hypothetical protein
MASDELHEWIDQIEDAANELASEKARFLDAGDLPDVCSIISSLMGYGSAYDDPLPRVLRLPPALVRKFQRFSGTVSLKEARILVDRLRVHLRSLDEPTPERPEAETDLIVSTPVVAKVLFPAIEWRDVPRTSEVKKQIAQVSQILDEIVSRVRRSNNAPDDRYITEIERKQLIAILETTLAVLKAPIIEKGLLLKTRKDCKVPPSKQRKRPPTG